MVNGIAFMGPLVDGAGRASVLGTEGEQVVGIVPRPAEKPSQTILRRQLINILVGSEVNATQANVANLQLGIVKWRNFRREVPLPTIGKVRVQRDALGCRTAKIKVEHVRGGS